MSSGSGAHSDGRSSQGVHSKNVDQSDTRRNYRFGATTHSPKGQRVPTEEENASDTISIAMEAYTCLRTIAEEKTSALYPLLSSGCENSAALDALSKLDRLKQRKDEERRNVLHELDQLNIAKVSLTEQIKESRSRIEQNYNVWQSDSERQRNIAIEEAKARHNIELAQIQKAYFDKLSEAAAEKMRGYDSIDLQEKNRFRDIDLKTQKLQSRLASLERFYEADKNGRAKIVFHCFFQGKSMKFLKLIAEVIENEISASTSKKKTDDQTFKSSSKIQEVYDKPSAPSESIRTPSVSYRSRAKPQFIDRDEQRQKKREEERRNREEEAKRNQEDSTLYNDMVQVAIVREHDSLLDSISPKHTPRDSESECKKKLLSKSTNRTSTSRQERPHFLKKFSRQKRTKKRKINGNESVTSSTESDKQLDKNEDGETEATQIEFVGGGIQQTIPSECPVGNDVEQLVSHIRKNRNGGSMDKIDGIKRARLEQELASFKTYSGDAPLQKAETASIVQIESFQQETNLLAKSLDEMEAMNIAVDSPPKKDGQIKEADTTEQVVSFGQVLGAVIPYTGPPHPGLSAYGAQIYALTDSDGDCTSDDDSYSSDNENWLGRNGASLTNVYKQIASGDLTGTQYEDIKISAKKYESKVQDGYFKRNRYSTHGIISNPRMSDPPVDKRHKQRVAKGKGKGEKNRRKKNIDRMKPTSKQVRTNPDVHLDGLMIGRVTRPEDIDPKCPLVLAGGGVPTDYAAQFSNISVTGPFPYYTATLVDRCGYCGYLLINCKCTCFLGHTRGECLQVCNRGFHYTWEMAKAYADLLRAICTGNEENIRTGWAAWRRHRRDKLPDDMEKLENAFIRTFKWADRNGNLWRTGDDKTSYSSQELLAISDGSYHTELENYSPDMIHPSQIVGLQGSTQTTTPANFPYARNDNPGRVQHPYINSRWYSKSCGTLDMNGIPTTKPPCHICGWPSIRKKNDSFTFCSSCRNCQKVRTHFETWSKQSGVRGSNRGRKRARSNMPQKRGNRKKIDSTRFPFGSFGSTMSQQPCLTQSASATTSPATISQIHTHPPFSTLDQAHLDFSIYDGDQGINSQYMPNVSEHVMQRTVAPFDPNYAPNFGDILNQDNSLSSTLDLDRGSHFEDITGQDFHDLLGELGGSLSRDIC